MLTRFFSCFHFFIEITFIPLGHESWIYGCLGYTKQDVVLFCYDQPFFPQLLTAAQPPMSYRISFTSGSLIPSFCLSIKGRHDAPSLSLCSDGNKSDLALYVYEILLFLSAPYGGRLLNLTVVLLMLPAAACEYLKAASANRRSLHLPGWHKRLLSAYS